MLSAPSHHFLLVPALAWGFLPPPPLEPSCTSTALTGGVAAHQKESVTAEVCVHCNFRLIPVGSSSPPPSAGLLSIACLCLLALIACFADVTSAWGDGTRTMGVPDMPLEALVALGSPLDGNRMLRGCVATHTLLSCQLEGSQADRWRYQVLLTRMNSFSSLRRRQRWGPDTWSTCSLPCTQLGSCPANLGTMSSV